MDLEVKEINHVYGTDVYETLAEVRDLLSDILDSS